MKEESAYFAGEIRPSYEQMHQWELYAANLEVEYTQSVEEGLDLEAYREVFASVATLPNGEEKQKLANVLFEVISAAKMKEGYPYMEPSDLLTIQQMRRGTSVPLALDAETLPSKIHGAWMGRICGCMLGKTVEGMRTNELVPFLQQTDNYPMHRYIQKSDLARVDLSQFRYDLANRCYADTIDGMPVDDDTNYTVMGQLLIERYGRDFTPEQVAQLWLNTQSKDAYCTAERVAFCNFVKGYKPPQSAIFQNPYREWIGAQIRADYFGYINPGDPKLAAEMAWRDASISHVKNGIYGEMWVAAMLAVAACTTDIVRIIEGGLDEIPASSRLYEDVTFVLNAYRSGMDAHACMDAIHAKYDEYTSHGWCHTNSNAMIVAAALLYGEGDFGRSICMAVETGFDTDCNGATVGSILGMANGIDAIDAEWKEPFHDSLNTSIFGVGKQSIAACAEKTCAHVCTAK